MSSSTRYDLLVIGGGINGVGIACDAAGRGLSVLLCEANDLACATSSSSSKLIHGGLRYLEQHEFRLVREALAEREVLLQKAPHIIWPLRFVLPHHPSMRPRWMVRAGLFAYDNLYRRKLIPASSSIDLASVCDGTTLKADFRKGFFYWDCWVDDARLVVCNARGAANNGADIRTRTRVIAARPVGDGWQAAITNGADGATSDVFAKVIVNAAGPWADHVQNSLSSTTDATRANRSRLRLVKGSHIVVPRIGAGDDAFILQNPDGRVVFAIPYEGDYTLIGTTDTEFKDAPETVSALPEEVDYLLDAVGQYCRVRPRNEDVVWTYAGVRGLYDDAESEASKVTRDYQLELDAPADGASVLSVLGGKITTYRALAEDAMDKLKRFFPHMGPAWTKGATLPGGDLGDTSFEEFATDLSQSRPGMPAVLLTRLARRHGSATQDVLGDASTIADLGRHIGHDLYEREVAYLKQHEWARSADDILWRRTKAGLHLIPEERDQVQGLLEAML